jgi:drug/metabolite transporter (DMT)-like permease
MVRSSVGKSSGEPAGGSSGDESSPRGTNRPLGIFLILLSALFFSPAGVFSKGVDISAFSVVFWRGLFAAAAGLIYLQVIGTLRSEMRRMDKAGWFAAVVFAVGTLAFISAFKLTSVSNVSLIWLTAPVLGAFVGWVWFGARVTSPFVIAAIAVLIGTVILVSGSFGPDIAAADSAGAEMGALGHFLVPA